MRTYAADKADPVRETSLLRRARPAVEALRSVPERDAPRFLARAPGHGTIALQPKLSIGTPGGAHEQEADRVAAQIVANERGGGTPSSGGTAAHGLLQAKHESAGAPSPVAAPPIVHYVLESPGRPLDTATRAFMEPRFGRDFSDVRVHTGALAARSAEAIGARAYTAGRDIVFGRDEFAPDRTESRRLIAHELAHVVQQGSARAETVKRKSDEKNGAKAVAATLPDVGATYAVSIGEVEFPPQRGIVPGCVITPSMSGEVSATLSPEARAKIDLKELKAKLDVLSQLAVGMSTKGAMTLEHSVPLGKTEPESKTETPAPRTKMTTTIDFPTGSHGLVLHFKIEAASPPVVLKSGGTMEFGVSLEYAYECSPDYEVLKIAGGILAGVALLALLPVEAIAAAVVAIVEGLIAAASALATL